MYTFFTGIITLMALFDHYSFNAPKTTKDDTEVFNLTASEEHTLPPDLMFMTKSDLEHALEECMSQYSNCLSLEKPRNNYDYKLCALERNTAKKATFNSTCELIYENCKQSDTGGWGYYHDGPCAVEFVLPQTNSTET